MKKIKSYTIDELTAIGRLKFNLNVNWHCFYAEVVNEKLKYGLSPKDENNEWRHEWGEIYGYVPLYEK